MSPRVATPGVSTFSAPGAQPLAVGQVSRPALPQLGTIALETEPAAGSRHGGADGSPRLGRSRSRDLPNVATSGDTARKSACATSTGVRHKNTFEDYFRMSQLVAY